MLKIKVPKTPKGAFNTKRKPSDLLLSQISHLQQVTQQQQPPGATRRKSGRRVAPVKTEGQAAALIAKLTRQLHPEGAKPARGKRR